MLVYQRAPFGGKLDLIGISMTVGLNDTQSYWNFVWILCFDIYIYIIINHLTWESWVFNQWWSSTTLWWKMRLDGKFCRGLMGISRNVWWIWMVLTSSYWNLLAMTNGFFGLGIESLKMKDNVHTTNDGLVMTHTFHSFAAENGSKMVPSSSIAIHSHGMFVWHGMAI